MAPGSLGRDSGRVPADDVDPADRYGELWAEVYDDEYAALVPPERQLALLAELASGGRALELGIGTGRVALPLVARGVDVHGVDASPAMVARLRAKPGGDALTVTIGAMTDPPVAGPFHLVYVVFNTFFALPTQDEQVACFRKVADLLEPDGVFVLECSVPDLGRFDGGQSLRTGRLTDGEVRFEASRHDPVGQVVNTSIICLADGATSVRPIRLRYAWPAEIDLMAQVAGLQLRARLGGWDGESFAASSGAHVSIYGRPATARGDDAASTY